MKPNTALLGGVAAMSLTAALADRYNEPGRFTAFAGYEWTSIGSYRQTFGNLHRVVVFRDDFWGKYSSTFPSPTRMLEPMVGAWPSPLNWETSASGAYTSPIWYTPE